MKSTPLNPDLTLCEVEIEKLPVKADDLTRATSGQKVMATNSAFRAKTVTSSDNDTQGDQEHGSTADSLSVSSTPTDRPDASSTNGSRGPNSGSEDETRDDRTRRRQEPEITGRPERSNKSQRQHHASYDDYEEEYLLPVESRPSQGRGKRHSHVPADASLRSRHGRESHQEVRRYQSHDDVRYNRGPSRQKYRSGRDELPPPRDYAASTRSREKPLSRHDPAVIYVSRSGRRIYESRSDSEEYDDYSGSDTATASELDEDYRVQETHTRIRSRRDHSGYDRQTARGPDISTRSHGSRREVRYVQDEMADHGYQTGRLRAVDTEGPSPRLSTKNSRSRVRSRPSSPNNDEETVQSHGDRKYVRVSDASWAPSGQLPVRSGSAHLPDLDNASIMSSVATTDKKGVINTSNPISRIQFDIDFTMRKLLNEQVFEEFIRDPLGRHR